jgi:hypothetical protein
MKPLITLDDLDIVASVTRRNATPAEVASVVAEIQGWHADEDEPYTVTAGEVAAVMRMRELLIDEATLLALMPQVR